MHFVSQLTVAMRSKQTPWASPEDPSRLGQMLTVSDKGTGPRNGKYFCVSTYGQPWVWPQISPSALFAKTINPISEFYLFQWRVAIRIPFLEHIFSAFCCSPHCSPLVLHLKVPSSVGFLRAKESHFWGSLSHVLVYFIPSNYSHYN